MSVSLGESRRRKHHIGMQFKCDAQDSKIFSYKQFSAQMVNFFPSGNFCAIKCQNLPVQCRHIPLRGRKPNEILDTLLILHTGPQMNLLYESFESYWMLEWKCNKVEDIPIVHKTCYILKDIALSSKNWGLDLVQIGD